ncbi:MAG: ABC transporter permease [Lagierella massiliensis]|nr:ABC transporter permease [Lagierella massiliensis]
MWKTVLRRVLIMIPQLLILSIFVFVLAKFMPGDPFTGMIDPNTPKERLEELREKAGLNDPIPVQYTRWLKNAMKGDFGKSYTMKMPVNRVIGERAKNTFWLALLSMLIMYAISLPLGILAGRYNGSRLDQAINLYNFLTLSIPGFVMYLVTLLIFGYRLKWFPTGGTVSIGASGGLSYIASRIYHMLLPALSYGLIATTGTVQYLRNEIIDAKTQDYVRTARAKGVPTKKVYTHHIFRNSLLPIAAFFGFQITGLLGGSVMIETVFAYPGMGSLFIDSISSRDYSVITTLVLLYGLLTLLGSLLSDIIMTIVDPRIRID